jgi:Tfp pilus assembly protein PilN
MRLRINLLSPERKQQAIAWLWSRFVLKQCLNIAALSVLIFCLTWGIGWLLRNQFFYEGISENSEQTAEISKELAGYQDEIKRTNAATQQVLDREKQHPRWSKLFERLETVLPDAITLDGIMNVDYRVSLSGVAANRDVLIQFRDRLTQDSCFEDVQLPLSNLFTQESVDFQMDMTFRKDCLKTFSL